MNFKWKRTIVGAVAPVVGCLLGTTLLNAQVGTEDNPQLAEDVFINVPALGDIPVDEFMDTMGMFSNALNLNCTDCHTENSMDTWAGFGEETSKKRTTRSMIAMVNAINRDNFGGVRNVTCFTCHRGDERPKAVASLRVQYGTPPEDPNAYDVFPGFGTPSIDEVFDAYIEALGGEEAVNNISSFVARGSYAGYDTDFAEVPVELYARSLSGIRGLQPRINNLQTGMARKLLILASREPIPDRLLERPTVMLRSSRVSTATVSRPTTAVRPGSHPRTGRCP